MLSTGPRSGRRSPQLTSPPQHPAVHPFAFLSPPEPQLLLPAASHLLQALSLHPSALATAFKSTTTPQFASPEHPASVSLANPIPLHRLLDHRLLHRTFSSALTTAGSTSSAFSSPPLLPPPLLFLAYPSTFTITTATRQWQCFTSHFPYPLRVTSSEGPSYTITVRDTHRSSLMTQYFLHHFHHLLRQTFGPDRTMLNGFDPQVDAHPLDPDF